MKLAVFLLTLPMFAAVDGIITNRTTATPQANATVTLYKLTEAGPEALESVKSGADGKFTISVTPTPGPHYIQAVHDGVTYTKMMPPGSPTTGVPIDVYTAQAKPGDAKVTQHMLLFEPADGKLAVTENIIYQNSGNVTFNDSATGTLKIFLPAATQGKARIMGTAPQGMPVEKAPMATKTANIFGVDFPIKPGETRFQISYELPMPDPPIYTAKIMHAEGTTRLVTPRGVTLKGDGISELGREPATQAAIYNLTGQDLKVEIAGTGSLRSAESSGGGGGGEEEGPSIQEIMPRVYDRVYLVLALAAGILIFGFVLVFRNSPTLTADAAAPAAKGKRRA